MTDQYEQEDKLSNRNNQDMEEEVKVLQQMFPWRTKDMYKNLSKSRDNILTGTNMNSRLQVQDGMTELTNRPDRMVYDDGFEQRVNDYAFKNMRRVEVERPKKNVEGEKMNGYEEYDQYGRPIQRQPQRQPDPYGQQAPPQQQHYFEPQPPRPQQPYPQQQPYFEPQGQPQPQRHQPPQQYDQYGRPIPPQMPNLSPNPAPFPQNPQLNPQNQGFYPQGQQQYDQYGRPIPPQPRPYQEPVPPMAPPHLRPGFPQSPQMAKPPVPPPQQPLNPEPKGKKKTILYVLIGLVVVVFLAFIGSLAMFFMKFG